MKNILIPTSDLSTRLSTIVALTSAFPTLEPTNASQKQESQDEYPYISINIEAKTIKGFRFNGEDEADYKVFDNVRDAIAHIEKKTGVAPISVPQQPIAPASEGVYVSLHLGGLSVEQAASITSYLADNA